MTGESDREVMLRFGRAVDAAIRDRAADQNGIPPFYFDTDVVVGTFFRFAEVARIVRHPSHLPLDLDDATQGVLVRTLWATGFACQARLLKPHRIELDRLLPVKPEHLNRPSGLSDVRTLVKQRFSEGHLRELQRTLSISGHSEQKLKRLAELMPLRYLALCAASLGNWAERLSLVGDRLVPGADPLPVNDPQAAARQERAIADIGGRLRDLRMRRFRATESDDPFPQARVERNSYADARALVVLNEFVRLADQRQAARPRFYTNTGSMIEVVALEWQDLPHLQPRELGEPGAFDCGVVDRPSGVLRSTTYMYLRSVLPCVAFRDQREELDSGPGAAGVSIEMLQRLVAAARRAAALPAPAGVTMSSEWSEFIHTLRSVESFMGVWTRSNSEVLKFLVEKLTTLQRGFGESISAIEAAAPNLRNDHGVVVREHFEARLRSFERAPAAGDPPEVTNPTPEEVDARVRRLVELGAARWLLILAPDADRAPEALRSIVRAANARGMSAMEGGRAQRILDSFNAEASVRLLALAVKFGEAKDSVVVDQASRPWPAEADRRVVLGAAYLRQCAELSSGEFKSDWNSSIAETASLGDRELMALGRFQTRCIVVMQAWRAFYWCHAHSRGLVASGEVRKASHCTEVASEALHYLEQVDHGNRGEWCRGVLREDVVSVLLGAFARKLREPRAADAAVPDAHLGLAYTWAAAVFFPSAPELPQMVAALRPHELGVERYVKEQLAQIRKLA